MEGIVLSSESGGQACLLRPAIRMDLKLGSDKTGGMTASVEEVLSSSVMV